MEKNISSLSLKELNKQKELINGVAVGLAIVLFLVFSFNIFLFISNGEMTPLFIVPIALLPILFISLNYVKKIKVEILKRNF